MAIPDSSFFCFYKQLPIFIPSPRTTTNTPTYVVQFAWMISHRLDSFIAFLTVGHAPLLERWEGADDNPLNGSLKPYKASTVYIADGQRINLTVAG